MLRRGFLYNTLSSGPAPFDPDTLLNFTPTEIGDLIASYDVNAVGGYTASSGQAIELNDFSANNYDLVNSVGSSPVINSGAFNGLTTLSFNGRSLQKLSLSHAPPYSVYFVVKQNDYVQTQCLLNWGADFTHGITQIDQLSRPSTVIVAGSSYRGNPNMYKSRFAILSFYNDNSNPEPTTNYASGYALDDLPFKKASTPGSGSITKLKLQGNMDFIEMHIFSKVLTRDEHIGLINNRLSALEIATEDAHVGFGDSITEGYGGITSWLNLNAAAKPIDYVNYAISGSSVLDVSNPNSLVNIYDQKGRIPSRAYLTFMYGWNEPGTTTGWKDGLRDILNYFIGRGHDKSKMFLLSAPNVQNLSSKIGLYRDLMGELATELGIGFIDVYQYTIDDVTYAPVSGTHPDQVQQQKIADYVYPLMFP